MALTHLTENFLAGTKIGQNIIDAQSARKSAADKQLIANVNAEYMARHAGGSGIPEAAEQMTQEQLAAPSAPQPAAPAPIAEAIPVASNDAALPESTPAPIAEAIPDERENKPEKKPSESEDMDLVAKDGQLPVPQALEQMASEDPDLVSRPVDAARKGGGLSTAEWGQWRQDLIRAAAQTGDPEKVQWANNYVTEVQHDGFTSNLKMAHAAMAGGDTRTAMSALKSAYKYFPDGADGEFDIIDKPQLDAEGKLVMRGGQPVTEKVIRMTPRDELTGEPYSPVILDSRALQQMVLNFDDPLKTAQHNREASYTDAQITKMRNEERRNEDLHPDAKDKAKSDADRAKAEASTAATEAAIAEESKGTTIDQKKADLAKTKATTRKLEAEATAAIDKAANNLLSEKDKTSMLNDLAASQNTLRESIKEAEYEEDAEKVAYLTRELDAQQMIVERVRKSFGLPTNKYTGDAGIPEERPQSKGNVLQNALAQGGQTSQTDPGKIYMPNGDVLDALSGKLLGKWEK